MWPNYALILFDFEAHKYSSLCNSEGVIILKNSLYSGSQRNEEVASCSILNDSIMAVTLAGSLNFNFSNTSFSSATGQVKFRENKRLINISIVQVRHGEDTAIAWYDSDVQVLSVSPGTLETGELPLGHVLVIESTTSSLHNALVLILFTFCFGFITVNFSLYFYFRNEPEIKATSVSVSVCLFLGCYLIIMYVPTLLVEAQPIKHNSASGAFICNLSVCLSGVGIPFTLTFATLFVKMLRVYVIFCHPHSYKKKLFSNPALFLYILVLVSPNIVILLIWIIVDRFSKIRVTAPMKSHVVATDRCLSEHSLIWVSTLMIYNSILVLALVILAFKTSKIRYKNFSDTKATNAFSFLSIFICYLSLVYWSFFRSLEFSLTNIRSSMITLYIGHFSFPLVCQLLLFVPKVFPPTKRWLYQNKVKRKN